MAAGAFNGKATSKTGDELTVPGYRQVKFLVVMVCGASVGGGDHDGMVSDQSAVRKMADAVIIGIDEGDIEIARLRVGESFVLQKRDGAQEHGGLFIEAVRAFEADFEALAFRFQDGGFADDLDVHVYPLFSCGFES